MFDALFVAWAARQQVTAQRADMAAERAATTATQVRSQVELMEMDLEKLLIITEALWTMLRDEHGYTDEQLLQKVQEIDMRDGRLDGRVAKQAPSKCPQCGRTISARRPACMFCGAASTNKPFTR